MYSKPNCRLCYTNKTQCAGVLLCLCILHCVFWVLFLFCLFIIYLLNLHNIHDYSCKKTNYSILFFIKCDNVKCFEAYLLFSFSFYIYDFLIDFCQIFLILFFRSVILGTRMVPSGKDN